MKISGNANPVGAPDGRSTQFHSMIPQWLNLPDLRLCREVRWDITPAVDFFIRLVEREEIFYVRSYLNL